MFTFARHSLDKSNIRNSLDNVNRQKQVIASVKQTSLQKQIMSVQVSIAARIKEYRQLAGMNQAQLAEKVGITRAGISAIEKGKSGAKATTLALIAQALGVKQEDLLSEESVFTKASKRDHNPNNVQAIGFLADMAAVDLPFVSFRARASFVELGLGIQHPNNFETLRLYVSSEEEAARYTGALVFEVEGDSMEPILRTGDKVIAWQVPDSKWEQVYNQVCVVAYDDTVTIKAVRENELFTRNLLTLYSQNPAAGFLPVQRQQIQSVWRVEEFFDRPKIRL
ncbi:XRE family transcriptional regulator [Hymenobacter fodinae]|uniref:XRE family transcriptional regulator n=1 Tax=Hymenobacter fodinae TaxID=2510796 RepID=UPI0014369E09|nr:XRE family transcriptional regulator [Hymenobacter fodinae]